jgi:hypothetical protein
MFFPSFLRKLRQMLAPQTNGRRARTQPIRKRPPPFFFILTPYLVGVAPDRH